ncbi:hypothetical protein PaecuDRAFT_2460 [Paenibacillus curdlanolyticus YK9]|uniref:Uncharacterized protein n=1 Tax=Paenibacillus curdlanolyticus YK9 TaxID=717606 RepID=E0I9X3_9BACL|nr:hypothetical protein [Paenibacillus curdlanolyticus]EFM10550.1 hypothetical protein PaecuDRAFT_2460 [Paenibacillus curdlanolyticus YK9]
MTQPQQPSQHTSPTAEHRPGRLSPPPAGSKALIKLAIGRLLIDTSVAGLPFDVREAGGRWTIAVTGVESELAAYIEANAAHLNLFYFEALSEREGDVQKFWMYDEHQPAVHYEQEARVLSLTVGSYMAYSNEKV